MIRGTEVRGRWASRLALLLVGLVALGPPSGCAVGVVRTSGYRSESALRFERAATDGERLWLAYRSEARDRAGATRGEALRAVVVRLADLDPAAPIPVDEFPIERRDPAGIAWSELAALPLRAAPRAGEPALLVVPGEAGEPPSTRTRGLLLHEVPGAPEGAQLRAAVLTKRFHTAWSYPLLAPAGLWDAFWIPQLFFFGLPLFLWND